MLNDVLRAIGQGRNVCMIAPGGAGKSYTIAKVYESMLKKYGSLHSGIYVTAMTGAACVALNEQFSKPVCGTLHSTLGIGLAEDSAEELAKYLRKDPRTAIKSMRLLVIDEVSMLNAELFDKIEELFRRVRRKAQPFGGVKLLLSGDFLQLPPVQGKYCFEGKSWDSVRFRHITSQKIYRYTNKKWQELLLRMRTVVDMTKEDDAYIISRTPDTVDWYESGKYMMLFANNKSADTYNLRKFRELNTELRTYLAADSSSMCPRLFDKVAPSMLVLKEGAYVMLTRNIDVASGLVNGAQGTILECSDSAVDVAFTNGVVRTVYAELYSVAVKCERKVETHTRHQIPLKFSWAGTIHKSQGSTLDRVVVDMKNAYQKSQAYVALSRVRNPDNGLVVLNYNPDCVHADEIAHKFCMSF